MDLSFSSKCRLKSKQEFDFVFARPSKLAHKNWLVFTRKNTLAQPRLGIIIKKTHIKHAVKRTLLRRIIRESFRHHKAMVADLDIIVLLRSTCSPLNKLYLRQMIDELWLKVSATQGGKNG